MRNRADHELGLHVLWRRLTLAALVALMLLASIAGPAAGAGAQTDGPIRRLLPERRVIEAAPLRIDVEVPVGVTELGIVVHEAVVRSQLQASFVSGNVGPGIRNRTVSISPDANGRASFTIANANTLTDGAVADVSVPLSEGVHPVTVTFGDDGPSETMYLAVLGPPDPSTVDLSIALIVPFDVAPSLAGDGRSEVPAEARVALEKLASILESAPGSSLTVTLPPELIDALTTNGNAEDRALVDRLRPLLNNSDVLSQPYVGIDEQAWAQAGRADVIQALYERGDSTLLDELAVTPSRSVSRLDLTASGPAITALRDLGVEHVVVDENLLEPLDTRDFPLTLTKRFQMSGTGVTTIDAVATNPLLDMAFASDEALDHSLADLHVLYFDQPAFARGTVLTTPDLAELDAAAMIDVLTAIEDSPVLEAVTLPVLFAQVDEARSSGNSNGALLRRHDAKTAADLGDFPAQRDAVSDSIGSFASLVGTAALVDPLRDLVDVSTADSLARDARDIYLDTASQIAASSFDDVRLEERSTLNVTSRESSIAIRIDSDLAVPAEVRLEFSSDGRLRINDDEPLDLTIQPGLTEVEVPVEATASGEAPFDVAVVTRDGRVELARTEMTIRSTQLSGVAIFITIGAVAVLLLWWLRQFDWARRRSSATTVSASSESEPE